jgi:histidine transport system permease protein
MNGASTIMNWTDYLLPLLHAAALTVGVACASLCLAVACGLLGAGMKLSASGPLRALAGLYTSVVRGVPDLVLMLIVFYGGQFALNALAARFDANAPDLNPAGAGILTIGLIYGGFFTETFRGAFQSVPAGQLEAGAAFGMRPRQVFARILLPQMLRFAIPGIGNNWLVLLKSTAIVSMIGLADMTWMADQAGRSTGQPLLFYLLVCLLYMAMSALSSVLLARLNRRHAGGAAQEFRA